MSVIVSMYANSLGIISTPDKDLLEGTTMQSLVKDEVVFSPTPDPYIAFSQAVEKLFESSNNQVIQTQPLSVNK